MSPFVLFVTTINFYYVYFSPTKRITLLDNRIEKQMVLILCYQSHCLTEFTKKVIHRRLQSSVGDNLFRRTLLKPNNYFTSAARAAIHFVCAALNSSVETAFFNKCCPLYLNIDTPNGAYCPSKTSNLVTW